MASAARSTFLRFRILLLPYSTSSATFRVSNLSEKLLGISKAEATSSPWTKVSPSESLSKNPYPAIVLFEKIGLDNSQIEKITTSHPSLLRTNVEKTLEPRIRVLQDLGLYGSDLVSLIVAVPSRLFGRSFQSNMLPRLEFLKSVLGSTENVVNAIKKVNWLASASLEGKLMPNVLLLKSYGISNENIQKILLRHPGWLVCSSKWVEESLARVEQVLGIPRQSGMFVQGFRVMVMLNKRTFASKVSLFKKYGWSESDVLTMAKTKPDVLNVSEVKLRTAMNFFVNELGYEHGYLTARPVLLLLSMEKNILPKHAVLQVLKEKKLIRTTLSSVLFIGESKFLDMYVLPYKDKLPEMYEAYMNNKMDCVVQCGK